MLNVEEVIVRASEFDRDPAATAREGLIAIGFSEEDADWATSGLPPAWADEQREKWQEVFRKQVEIANPLKKRVPAAVLKHRRRSLIAGAVLICLGIVFQVTGVFVQWNPLKRYLSGSWTSFIRIMPQ